MSVNLLKSNGDIQIPLLLRQIHTPNKPTSSHSDLEWDFQRVLTHSQIDLCGNDYAPILRLYASLMNGGHCAALKVPLSLCNHALGYKNIIKNIFFRVAIYLKIYELHLMPEEGFLFCAGIGKILCIRSKCGGI